MQQNPSSKIHGLELLSFEATELYKIQGQTTTFLDQGTLNVMYFDEQIRFLLSLNYWDYALLKRLPVIALTNNHSYAFPASDGYFILKLTKIPNHAALVNFETILKYAARFHHEGEDVPDFVLDKETIENLEHTSLESQKLSAMSLIKRGITKVTDKVYRTLTKSHKENPNMTQIKDIDSLKSTSPEFLSTHEYSKDDIENAVNRSKDFCSLSHHHASESIHQGTTFTESTKKSILEEEIEVHRRIQEEARKMQEDHRRKELEAIEKERQLEALLWEKQQRLKEANQQESILREELEEKTRTIQQEQKKIEGEHEQYERREQELRKELERRINELKSKERMTENELSELTLREQELIQSNQRLETETRILQKKLTALSKKLEQQETKAEELSKEDTLKVEKELLKKEEGEVQRLISDEVSRLMIQEDLLRQEREKYQQMEEDLYQIYNQDERKRATLEKAQKEFDSFYEYRIKELEKQRAHIQVGKTELEKKAQKIEQDIQARLADLKRREDLTEQELLEVGLREGELAMITQLIKAEEIKTKMNLKECWEEFKKRESEVKEHEKFVEDQSSKLVEIAKVLESVVDLEEKEKNKLDKIHDPVKAGFAERLENLLQQKKINEIEYEAIQKDEEAGRVLLEKELLALKGKELLTEAEKLKCDQIERRLAEVNQIYDSKLKQLEAVKQHEASLLAQNQQLLQGHQELHHQIQRFDDSLNKNVSQQSEYEQMTSG